METVTAIPMEQCPICGEPLHDIPYSKHERRTKIDIVFEKVTEHVDVEVKQCPACQNTVKEKFLTDMPGPRQYGHGLMAFIINLLTTQMIALRRAQQLLSGIIGEVISEATMLGFILRLHHALENWETNAIRQLLKSKSINVDETSLRVDKKNHWVHVYSSGGLTLKFIHPKRGMEAIETIDIIPRYNGIIVHGCWASYLAYKHCGHALCGSHLWRELTFIVDSNQYRWAINMKNLLRDTCKRVGQSENKVLTDMKYANLQKRYRNIITRGEKELPAIIPKSNGKGRIAKSDAHNLWERLKKYEASVLLFAKNPDVPFTNNRAERDLRMAKVKQKVSGCFRSEQFAKAYCRISSYLQSMSYQGASPILAIQMALSGKFHSGGGE